MKKLLLIISVFCLLLTGCKQQSADVQVVATTMPVYTFCRDLCVNTDITVAQLIQDNISCLHNYTLQVGQMQMLEGTEIVIINGAGLEDFLDDALSGVNHIADASLGIDLSCEEGNMNDHHHHHSADPHIWLSPILAKTMAQNICAELKHQFPQYTATFDENLAVLTKKLDDLYIYGQEQLKDLSCRDMITFHNGFSYFAQCFDLNILAAIEEESGSETSAAQLVELIKTVDNYQLPAIFTEVNSSTASANVVTAETGADSYSLNMAISQGDYFEIMYRNIDTVKEALG